MNLRIVLIVCFWMLSLLAWGDFAKVGVLVLDEKTDTPIGNVPVKGYFTIEENPWSLVKGGRLPNTDTSVTDSNGRCTLRGRTNCGRMGCWIEEPPSGYYCPRGGEGFEFTRRNLLGIWQPDNLVATIRLQRVEHPIPLFVKSIRDTTGHQDLFTQGGGTLRLDLLEGDWLPPVGRGKVADVEFKRLPRQSFGEWVGGGGVKGESYRDSMSVKFLGEGNGLVVLLPSPKLGLKIRTAPEDGYTPDYLCWKEVNKKLEWVRSYDVNRCFCFRIRTRRNEKGEIVEAYYGKIYRDIYFGYSQQPDVPVATVKMFYYLNPTSLDRNLEWDRQVNLCANPGGVSRYPSDRVP